MCQLPQVSVLSHKASSDTGAQFLWKPVDLAVCCGGVAVSGPLWRAETGTAKDTCR